MSGAPSAKRQRTNAIGNAAVPEIPPVEFDDDVISVYEILNVKDRRLSSSEQTERGFEAAEEIEECVRAVGRATRAHSRMGTKRNALVALLEIATGITACGGEFGNALRNAFEYYPCVEATMLRIVRRMTTEEWNALVKEGFEDELVNFELEANQYGIFQGMEDVRQALIKQRKTVLRETNEADRVDGEGVGENDHEDDSEESGYDDSESEDHEIRKKTEEDEEEEEDEKEDDDEEEDISGEEWTSNIHCDYHFD